MSGTCFECTLAAATMLAMAGAQAQAQSESAHPPSAVAASPGEPQAAPANRLRSVLISPGRKLAIIDGITVPLGGMVGGARLVRITDTEVLLKTGTETEVLKLFPGIDKRPSTQGAARAAGVLGREFAAARRIPVRLQIAAMLLVVLTGCAAVPPPPAGQPGLPQPPMKPGVDANLLGQIDKPAERKAGPRSDALEQALLPPLRMEMPSVRGQPIDPRFDLSVNNAPASQVFMSVVSGTRFSMLVHPSVSGTISVNLMDVTLREALDSIRDLYGYEYRIEGTRILVLPAGVQTRIFQVNYLLGERRGISDVRVQSGSVTDAGAGSAADTPGAQGAVLPGGARGLESSRVTTRIQNDFWIELRASLTAIVGTGEGRNVVISPQSGVVVVRALPAELRGVEQYLRATRISVERQVMLEAKIIDVELSDSHQSGINWALLPDGRLAAGESGGAANVAANMPLTNRRSTVDPGAALFGLALQIQNFAELLQFLETQGKVQVLSSPRVATLNNQKAVLKVGTDEFFVTNVQSAATVLSASGTAAGSAVPSVTVQPFFSGIVLDVTPQIDENNQIILHVHPSVSQVSTDHKDIGLGAAGNLRLPLARSNVNETDTIVRVTDGNIVALGGLMKLDLREHRGALPGTVESAAAGTLRNASTQMVKKEMVILLKPTIIQGNRGWEEGIEQVRGRFEALGAPQPARERPR